MSAETSPGANQRIYRLRLTSGYFNVIKAMSTEHIERCMREGVEPSKSDTFFLNKKVPFIRAKAPSLQILADKLDGFADDTEAATTTIALDWPNDFAEEFMAERQEKGKLAAELAETIRGFVTMHMQLEEGCTNSGDWRGELSA